MTGGRMFEMVAQQLLATAEREAAALAAASPRQAYNPKPPGQIQPGSSTEAVLCFLRTRPGQWFSRWQIIQATQRANVSVNHALTFLVAIGTVRTALDGQRNPRYLRYSFPLEEAR